MRQAGSIAHKISNRHSARWDILECTIIPSAGPRCRYEVASDTRVFFGDVIRVARHNKCPPGLFWPWWVGRSSEAP